MTKKLGLAFAYLWFAAPLVWAQAAPPESAVPSGLAQAKAAQKAAPPSSVLDSSLFYELLLGEITSQEGDAAEGFALMLDAARKTNDAQLYQRATNIALQAHSGDAALQAARAWKQALPASRDANRYLLQILIALNRIDETAGPLKTEITMAPDVERAAVITAIPQTYGRVSDKKLAATVVERALGNYLTQAATATAAWTTVARMRLSADDSAGALDAAQRAQATDAHAEGPVIVALQLMQAKQPEAEKLVQRYLQDPADSARVLPEIRMAYARTLLDAQRYADAAAQIKTVTHDKPEFADAWLVLGSLQQQNGQLDQAQTSLERYAALVEQAPQDTRQGLTQAYLSLSQLAEKRKDYAAAESWLNKIDSGSDLALVQLRRAAILASQGKLEEGRQLIHQLPERNPDEAQFKLSAEIGLLREVKHYRQAHDVLAQALTKAPDNTDWLYEQAMLAEKLDSLDEMERLLRQVIALKPDYYNAYNALGYSLADRNMRLPEARELIKKALTYAPADPFIQDSLGWVEFRMGHAADAAQIFEAAYQARHDAEIAAHFGEVLWSLGEHARAVAIWKEGIQTDASNETLQETLKRLQVKL